MTRLRHLMLLLVVAVAGCDAERPTGAAGRDCTAIVSAVERLACFDAAAGTPPAPSMPRAPAQPAASAAAAAIAATAAGDAVPEVTRLLRRNEAARVAGDGKFLLARSEDTQPGQWKLVLSAPALGTSVPRAYLAISCLSNISRLQLVADKPVALNRVNMRLSLDDRPLSGIRPWQVLEDGTVVDAGRGLVAIEQLRHLAHPGARLQLDSDHPSFDGLVFDAAGLQDLIAQQREVCHW
ncbi:type VI secretion system-associated protein VasI [Cupriavidus sp. 30B13]|uniref:type VI secretion system-associated protein VasI n=1 Tax=Cupriavidus sp. 30B13 TaxID=3384241 RepID=UPI003B91A97E